MGDARDNRAEDERRDRHLDELDETPTEELDPIIGRKGGKEPSDERAENDCDEHLDVERRIPVTTSCSHRSPPMGPGLGRGLRTQSCARSRGRRNRPFWGEMRND